MKVEVKNLSVTLKFDADKKLTGLDGVAEDVAVKAASGTPSEDDLQFTKASATLTVTDSHTFADLSGIHYTTMGTEYDRTKFAVKEGDIDKATLRMTVANGSNKADLAEMVMLNLEATETAVTVTFRIPERDVTVTKTVRLSELDLDREENLFTLSTEQFEIEGVTYEVVFVLAFVQDHNGFDVKILAAENEQDVDWVGKGVLQGKVEFAKVATQVIA